MEISLTSTLGDYLEYATAGSGDGTAPGPASLPVLDPAGRHQWPRRIAERLGLSVTPVPPRTPESEAPVAASPARDGRDDHLVVALADDPAFGAPAVVFARAKGARLVPAQTTEQVVRAAREVPADGFLTVVGPEWALDFALCARLRREAPAVHTGMLCGPTPGKLSELVLKTLVYPRFPAGHDEFFAGLLKGAEPVTNGRLTVYPADAVDARRLTDGSVLRRVLSFIAHASEDYLRVTPQDILCGLTDDPTQQAAARDAAGPLPACLQGDGCVYPQARRHDPAAVPAQLVFANACLTLKFGTQLLGEGNRFTISRRFLDGWTGCFVASPLLKDGTPAENLLFHALIADGAPVGAAVRAVNQNLERWGIDAPAVLVVGDPEAVYSGGRDGRTDGPPEEPSDRDRAGPAAPEQAGGCAVEYFPDRVVLRYDRRMPATSRVRLEAPNLLTAHRNGTLDVRPDPPFGGRMPFYAATVEAAGGVEVLLLGVQDRQLAEDEAPRSLELRAAPPAAELDRLVAAFARYENLPFLDIRLDRGRAVLTDMVNHLPTVARRARAARCELTESERLARSVQRIREKCRMLDRGILDKLLHATESREYHFVEAYRHTYAVLRAEPAPEPCRYCGEAFHHYLSANVLRPAFRRHLHSCPVCGAVQDTEDGTVSLTITGDNRLRPESDTELDLVIGNSGAEELELLLGGRITHGAQHGFGFRFDEELVHVPPGGTARSRLTVSTARPSVRHSMLLRCYAVGLGRIEFAGRDLYVR